MRSSWFRHLTLNSSSTLSKHIKNCFNTFCSGALNFSKKYRLHQPWASSQERRIKSSSGSWDHLSSRPINRAIWNLGIYYSKFDISHRLIAQWPFPRTPFKSLNQTRRYFGQYLLINPINQCVVDENVGSCWFRAKTPYIRWG